MCNLFLLNNYIFEIVYKMLDGNCFAILNHCFMNPIWMFYSRIMENYVGATSWDCIGATSRGLKCHEVPRIMQSATCNLLQMKN